MSSPPGVLGELGVVTWLKTRELLGESRRPHRLVLGALVLVLWTLLLVVGANLAAATDPDGAERNLVVLATALWPLWAVVPLVGGGAGEVTSAARLAPYPVTPRAQMLGALVSALLDFPVLVGLPVLVAVAAALAGWWGALAAVVFALGAAALGQVGAWAAGFALAGRTRPGPLAVVSLVLLVALLVAAPTLLPESSDLSGLLPGGWLASAVTDASAGRWVPFALWALLLGLPVVLFVWFGPVLVAAALDRQASSPGVRVRPWRGPSRFSSPTLLLALAALRSTVRASSTQAALAGALAAPFLVRLPLGSDADLVSPATLGVFAALAAGASLAVNLFAFDAGGASVLLSAPVSPRRLLLAKACAGVVLLTLVQVAVVLVASVLASSSSGEAAQALASAPERALLVTAVGLRWSVRHPLPVDVDSLRNKISSPGAVMGFLVTSSVLVGLLDGVRLLPVGALLAPVLFVSVSALWWLLAARSLAGEGAVRVAASARG